MNEHGVPAFMPFPMMFQSPYVSPERQREDAPARIKVALTLLDALTTKQMTRAAANPMSIELIDGLKLTTAEANAQATACNMLGKSCGVIGL